MSKFTAEQVAAIRAQSEKLLADKPPPAPAQPVRREVPLVFEDDLAKWKREAAESDRQRAEAKAALRRAEGDHARVLSAVGRIAALEQRVAELERDLATSDATMRELARGAE